MKRTSKKMSSKKIKSELAKIGFDIYAVYLRVGGVSLKQVQDTVAGRSNNPSILIRLEELGINHGRRIAA